MVSAFAVDQHARRNNTWADSHVVFSAGLTAGAFVWGMLVDIIGRRWAFNLTVGIVAIFGKSTV